MDENTLAIYIHELRNLCQHCQTSFDLFNNAMRNQRSSAILYGGQMVLMPTSQISALLWPSRARSRGRGEKLREILKLPEKHALNDRRLSELWERSDEKIEDWISTTKGDKVAFDYVGNPQQLGEGFKTSGIYRAYDPNTLIYYYRGVAYNFQALANALMDIGGRVNAVYRQMFPEQAKAEDEMREKYLEAMKKAQEEGAAKTAEDGGEVSGEAEEATKAPAAKPSTAKKATVKKAAAKKPAAKKATEKKPAAKKTATKKPAAKKAAPKKSAAKKKDT